MIPKPQDLKPQELEALRSDKVFFNRFGMLATINFDHQFPFQADEIDDVSGDRRLAAEFIAQDLPVTETMP